MGPANSVVKDPTFGNYIVRVTDTASENSYGCSGVGEFCTTPSASDLHAWNATSDLFYCYRNASSPLVFEWDDANLQARFVTQAKLVAPEFDLVAPSVMWGINPTALSKLRRFDIATGEYQDVVDFSSYLGVTLTHTGKTSVTRVGEVGVVCGTGGQQNTDQYVIVYNVQAGTGMVLDTVNSEINGSPLPNGQKLGWHVHGGSYDPGGRFFFLTPTSGEAPNQDYIWDNVTQTVYPFQPQDMGHFGIAYGRVVNNCYFGSKMGMGVRRAEQSEVANVHNVFPAGAQYSASETHTSLGAAVPGGSAYPIFSSAAGLREDATGPNDICGGEIWCCSTDHENPEIHRFCQVWTIWPVDGDPGQLNNTPRGNASPNGRAFSFTSNWRCGLGTSPKGWPRKDVFVVQCL
jgi:hypothetical protein